MQSFQMLEQIEREQLAARQALMIGHQAAGGALLWLGPERDPTFDPDCWPAGGLLLIESEAREPASELGLYVCASARTGEVAGETLFRRAAEIGLHRFGSDAWSTLPPMVKLAYELFCTVTAQAFRALAATSPAAAVPHIALRPAIDDTIYEREGTIYDREPQAVRAAAAMQHAPPPAVETPIAAVAPAAKDPAKPLFDGERPIDMSLQAKKHGGRRTKTP